jgi:hypothetical protein
LLLRVGDWPAHHVHARNRATPIVHGWIDFLFDLGILSVKTYNETSIILVTTLFYRKKHE